MGSIWFREPRDPEIFLPKAATYIVVRASPSHAIVLEMVHIRGSHSEQPKFNNTYTILNRTICHRGSHRAESYIIH